MPPLPLVRCHAAENHTVSGVLAPYKIVPAVADTRRSHLAQRPQFESFSNNVVDEGDPNQALDIAATVTLMFSPLSEAAKAAAAWSRGYVAVMKSSGITVPAVMMLVASW